MPRRTHLLCSPPVSDVAIRCPSLHYVQTQRSPLCIWKRRTRRICVPSPNGSAPCRSMRSCKSLRLSNGLMMPRDCQRRVLAPFDPLVVVPSREQALASDEKEPFAAVTMPGQVRALRCNAPRARGPREASGRPPGRAEAIAEATAMPPNPEPCYRCGPGPRPGPARGHGPPRLLQSGAWQTPGDVKHSARPACCPRQRKGRHDPHRDRAALG